MVVRDRLRKLAEIFLGLTELVPIVRVVGLKLTKPLLKTPEQGAQTTIYLATSAEVEGVTGKYFANCKVAPVTAEANDAAIAKRLWEVSEQQTQVKS